MRPLEYPPWLDGAQKVSWMNRPIANRTIGSTASTWSTQRVPSASAPIMRSGGSLLYDIATASSASTAGPSNRPSTPKLSIASLGSDVVIAPGMGWTAFPIAIEVTRSA